MSESTQRERRAHRVKQSRSVEIFFGAREQSAAVEACETMDGASRKYISLYVDASGSVVEARVLDAQTEHEARLLAVRGGTANAHAKGYELWRDGRMTARRGFEEA